MNDVSKRKYKIKKKDRKDWSRKQWSEEARAAQSKRMKEMWRLRKLKKQKAKLENKVNAGKIYMTLTDKVEPKPMWKRIIDAILGR
tara:strand:+ start:1326 stop:1583 length:258 start_codon:yes stop_codon:yes gene_type:complete